MSTLWSDAMASLTGDAGAKARLADIVKNGTAAYDSLSSLIGSGRAAPVAPSVPAATGTGGAVGLMPSSVSLPQLAAGLSAVALVLFLALRRR